MHRVSGDMVTLTIALGDTASNVVDLGGRNIAGILNPAATTGATIAIKGAFQPDVAPVVVSSYDGTTTTALVITPSAGKIQAFTGNFATALRGLRYLQLVSASTELAVRTFYILLKD